MSAGTQRAGYAFYLLIGVGFGVVMLKSGAASWFRIYEMFSFESFHMYGIIGSALAVGFAGVQLIRRGVLRGFDGSRIAITDKAPGWRRYLFGGTLFGLGWGIAGACPGPIYVLIGAGYLPVVVVLASALLGTFAYGLLRERLPH